MAVLGVLEMIVDVVFFYGPVSVVTQARGVEGSVKLSCIWKMR